MIAPIPACSRQLSGILTPAIEHAAESPGADRYRKHFPATAHLWLLVQHGLSAAPSLRQSYATLAAMPDLFARLGLPQGISFSQLARSTTSRPSACLETLFADLVTMLRRQGVGVHRHPLLRQVTALDSTFVRLSEAVSPWSRHGAFTPGVRIQTLFDLSQAIPIALRLSKVDLNDHEALKTWDLEALRGWTLLIDRGYYGHRQFERLQQAEVSFVCPLQSQARFTVTAEHAMPQEPTPGGDQVLADHTITLGSPNNRAGTVLPGLRLVTSRNAQGEEHRLVTDRFDLTAAEVVQLYRYRWQIELFFRFLKHQLGLLQPLGYTRKAVWATVLLAAIITVLLMLTETRRPPAMSRIAWLRALGTVLHFDLRGG